MADTETEFSAPDETEIDTDTSIEEPVSKPDTSEIEPGSDTVCRSCWTIVIQHDKNFLLII